MYGTPGGIVVMSGGAVRYFCRAIVKTSLFLTVSAYRGRNSPASYEPPATEKREAPGPSTRAPRRALSFRVRQAIRRRDDARRRGRRLTSQSREQGRLCEEIIA